MFLKIPENIGKNNGKYYLKCRKVFHKMPVNISKNHGK
jgi:hypothetical protein